MKRPRSRVNLFFLVALDRVVSSDCPGHLFELFGMKAHDIVLKEQPPTHKARILLDPAQISGLTAHMQFRLIVYLLCRLSPKRFVVPEHGIDDDGQLPGYCHPCLLHIAPIKNATEHPVQLR